MKPALKQKLLKQKHEAMKRAGLTPPKNSEENRARAKEAHGY